MKLKECNFSLLKKDVAVNKHYAVLSCSVVSNSLQSHGLCSPPGSSVHWDSPGKNTGVGCYALLQGILPTQE